VVQGHAVTQVETESGFWALVIIRVSKEGGPSESRFARTAESRPEHFLLKR